LAHLVEKAADRVRTVGVLVAVLGVADGLVDLDFAPIRIELVGQNQGQGSPAPATHFGAIGHNGHRTVTRYPDEKIGLKRRAARRRIGGTCPQRFGQQARSQHEGTCRKGCLKKITPAEVLYLVHANSFAAW
jgi:hypothetical protein